MSEVIKLDINFLNKPLWVQVSRASKPAELWSDIPGYSFHSERQAPTELDMLFLLFILMKSQQDAYRVHISLSRYQILKGCGCPVNNQYIRRLEDSLQRWTALHIQFQRSFFDGQRYRSQQFAIIQNWEFVSTTKKLGIYLDPTFLSTIYESTHFKYIHFPYYKALKRPISRRLFEMLCVAMKGSYQWSISLETLGRKLALYSRQKSRPEQPVIYPSDVLAVVKPAVEEINRLSTDRYFIGDLNIDPNELLLLSYELKGKDKTTIRFRKQPLTSFYLDAVAQKTPDKPILQPEAKLQELFNSLKQNNRKIRKIVEEQYENKGFDYVKWNILYTNRYGSGNYAQYLKMALEHDWAFEFREEQELLMKGEQDANHPTIDLKAKIVKNIAKKADYIILARGRKYKIQHIYDNGTLEILREDSHMHFTLSPERAFNCRFESQPSKEVG